MTEVPELPVAKVVSLTPDMFSWDVLLADAEDGTQITYRLTARWSPEKDFVIQHVASCAAGQFSYESKRKHICIGTPKLLTPKEQILQ